MLRVDDVCVSSPQIGFLIENREGFFESHCDSREGMGLPSNDQLRPDLKDSDGIIPRHTGKNVYSIITTSILPPSLSLMFLVVKVLQA